MKITLTKTMFKNEFLQSGRADQFSNDALNALFDYFEECNPDMELDIVEVCCEYIESMFDQVMDDYKLDDDNDEGSEKIAIAYLQENTVIVANLGDRVVYREF